jgi:hypothetical protein
MHASGRNEEGKNDLFFRSSFFLTPRRIIIYSFMVVDSRIEESEFGRFGWAMDPEGNRLELRDPPDVKKS